MRVLILGGSGFIGTRLTLMLKSGGWATPICTSTRAAGSALRLDTRDEAAVLAAVRQVDAVVNCVAGSADAIAHGARVLARAARAARLPHVVHLSSMAVYGEQEGQVDEATPLPPARAWYGRAKQAAEAAMQELAPSGCAVTVLRPGCVWGPGSVLWVERIAQWLVAARLGDLGEGGDGWTNGVHVDDVCLAVMRALREPPSRGNLAVFNLAAPDSPRWNDYFADLALSIGATPVARISPLRLRLDAWLAGPPLQAARKLYPAQAAHLPCPISPQLVGLWGRQLHLQARSASQALGMAWTPYPRALEQAAAWWLTQRASSAYQRFA